MKEVSSERESSLVETKQELGHNLGKKGGAEKSSNYNDNQRKRKNSEVFQQEVRILWEGELDRRIQMRGVEVIRPKCRNSGRIKGRKLGGVSRARSTSCTGFTILQGWDKKGRNAVQGCGQKTNVRENPTLPGGRGERDL